LQDGRARTEKRKGNKVFDFNGDLRSRQVLALIFALLSGISAVSTAVLPAILHF
jgi:hypothetical protein